MTAQNLVDRLDFCKPTGKDKWLARCPAHDDRGPSLSITETTRGQVLVHCHAGCSPLDVITAVGLDWDSLFPPNDHYPARRSGAPKEIVDSLVVEIAEHDIARGKRLSRADKERFRDALKRKPPISDAVVEIAYETGAIK